MVDEDKTETLDEWLENFNATLNKNEPSHAAKAKRIEKKAIARGERMRRRLNTPNVADQIRRLDLENKQMLERIEKLEEDAQCDEPSSEKTDTP